MNFFSPVRRILSTIIMLISINGFSQTKMGNSKFFAFDHTKLEAALLQIAAYYKVQICNPNHLPGVSLGGSLSKSLPLEALLDQISLVEGSRAYLFYQNGIIFVRSSPFTHSFTPNKKEWPCAAIK